MLYLMMLVAVPISPARVKKNNVRVFVTLYHRISLKAILIIFVLNTTLDQSCPMCI